GTRALHAWEENKQGSPVSLFICKCGLLSEDKVNPYLQSKAAQKCARGHSALSVIVNLVKMFASPENHFQNDSFKALFLMSGIVNRMFYDNEGEVRALLLLDKSQAYLSAESLTNEDDVILGSKQLYRWKQLEEDLAIFE
ncbi:hypothetical protein E2I00_013191, partial [Balaenoptera physalus]